MLQRRSGSACAVLGNQLVLLGGNDGTQASICTNLDGFLMEKICKDLIFQRTVQFQGKEL